MTTGQIIKFLRKRENLSQKELGVILGVKKSSIQKYESGSVTNIKIDVLRKICDVFHIHPWVLVYPDTITDIENELDVITRSSGHLSTLRKLSYERRQKVFDYANDLFEAQQFIE